MFQLFDKLKKEQGVDIIKKVSAINGDCMLADLGLSAADKKFVQDTIEFVYHMAATIRFDEGLKKAIVLNTRGTKAMIDLCKGMKKLEVRSSLGGSGLFLHSDDARLLHVT